MDSQNQQKEQNIYFTGLKQDSSQDFNVYDESQNSLLSEQNLGFDTTDFACFSDVDRNVGLQVVPSFDDEVFTADASFSHIDYEHNGIHQNQCDTNYYSDENLGKLCESLACLPEEGEVCKDIDNISNIKTVEKAIAGPVERRQSDTDSLDVYLKPCVITPTKVEDLYSTLQAEHNIIFQFPPNKEILTCPEPTLQANQQNPGLNDSNVFEIQLCRLDHHDVLNIESSNDRNFKSYHSNDSFVQKFHCCSTNKNMRLSHRLSSALSEPKPQIPTNNDSLANVQSILSNTTGFQTCNYSESSSSNSSSFPPFLLELTSKEIFPPKPTCEKPAIMCQNDSNGRFSLNFDKKGYLHMEHKDTPSYDKEGIKTESQGKGTVINVMQKDSKTCPHHVQKQRRTTTTINNEEQTEPTRYHGQNFKRLSRHSKVLKKESNANHTSKKNHSENDVEMSSEVNLKEQTPCLDTRMMHNDTEKQRRDQMKTRFESLRQVIPKIERMERTPKVQILKQAWKYIRHLEEEEKTLEKIKIAEKEKNKRLLKKLQNIVKILKQHPQHD